MATISAHYRIRLPAAPSPEPPLVQFIVLSMLLHVLVVLLFGTPQHGGVGSLGEWRDVPFAVTLRALLTTRESPFKPSHGADQGSAGSPLARRRIPATSGAEVTPPRPETPRVEAPSGTTEVAPVEPPPAEPTGESPAREEPPVPGTLPRLDRGAPEVVDKAVVPDADVRPQEPPTETRPRVDLEAPRKVLPEAPPPAPARREPPRVTPPAAELATPPKEEPVVIPKPESLAPREVPIEPLPRIELEAPKLPPVVAPAAPQPETQPPTLPRIEQEATPKVESEKPALAEPPARRETPAETIPRVEPEAPPKAERPVVPPAPAVSPREAPPAVAPPRESAPAPAIERTIAPAAPQAAPREAPAEAPPRSQGEAPQKSETASPRAAQPPALREAPAAAPVPRLRYGQPPDDDIFTPRQPGETPAAGAPPIDLDAARKSAREPNRITSGRTGIIPLNLFPPPPEPESKLGRAIQKAAQPDCREAYAAMGLLAIPFLLKDTVTDTGCRW